MNGLFLKSIVGCAISSGAALGQGVLQPLSDVEAPDARRTSLVQRPAVLPADDQLGWEPGPAVFPRVFRTITGVGNNERRPTWGAAAHPLMRTAPVGYADGIGLPAGGNRPSARAVSNAVASAYQSHPNARGATDYLWSWGQFLDHDITETPIASPAEPFDVAVPTGDPFFDPASTGTQTIGLDRSHGVMRDGVRQQLNNITAFVDASNVYGSEDHRARALRTLDGTGRLKTSDGDLLPFNTDGLHNAPTSHDPSFFLAGDIRANEQVGLTALHTLFVREHNRLADEIRAANRELTGDEIYERARAIVAAQMQAITYNEFLPLLLGPGAIPPYQGYRDDVNPGISNEFATAAYRVGHTMLSGTLMRLDENGNTIPAGDIALRDAFFVPQETITHGIEPVLRGLAGQQAQEIDSEIVDAVRNFLFAPPGAGGFDLASLNIQRGRDHGLASYNQIRLAFGMTAAQTFLEITQDADKAAALASVYASPDDIDAWVGLLAEPHKPGAMVGETLVRVLRDQFVRLRDGDRFWYEAYLPQRLVDEVDSTLLSDILMRNMHGGGSMPVDVFMMPPECEGDMNRDGRMTVHDIQTFLRDFADNSHRADLNGDRRATYGDIVAFLGAYQGGCD
jgi:peroxidase